jgi:hypothetical protein
LEEAMNATQRDITELAATMEREHADAEDEPGGGLLTRARDSAVHVVSAYPRASLVGAFAIGFLLARVVRKLGEELS